ncbi:hypothetical protein [Stenotrophomonas rhizophila]
MKRIAAALLLAVTATGAHAAEPDKAVGGGGATSGRAGSSSTPWS